MIESLLCGFDHTECRLSKCMWYDRESQRCCIFRIMKELQQLNKSLEA